MKRVVVRGGGVREGGSSPEGSLSPAARPEELDLERVGRTWMAPLI